MDTRKSGTMRTIALSLIFSSLFIAVSVGAATTISTNITTDGNLTVTGTSAHTGLVTMVYASSTTQSLTGNLIVNGYATTTGSNGNFATAGTLTVVGTSGFTGLATFVNASTTAVSCLANCAFGSTATTTISAAGVITTQSTAANTITYASTTAITATTASTTNLIVGGNSTNGTLAAIIFGTCDLTQTVITASTSATRTCSNATAVTTAFKVFVQATSTLGPTLANAGAQSNGFVIVSASSTGAGTIGVEISNLTGANNTPIGSLNFWAFR